MPTLSDVYRYTANTFATSQILVGGFTIPRYRDVVWDFAGGPGTSPTANFEVYHPRPDSVVEGASVRIDAGYNGLMKVQFVGKIVNIRRGTVTDSIECVGDSDALNRTYRRTVRTIASEDATAVVEDLLQAAGIVNYFIDLPAWTIGAVVPAVLEFENYGDAINEIARVDGDPWYMMPDGQVRIERRDPLPAGSAFRQYYSGQLSALTPADRILYQQNTLPLTAIQPTAISDPDLVPRIRSLSMGSRYQDVKNSVILQGAVVTSDGPDGRQVSERLEIGPLQAPSPFITVPPTYQEVTVSFDLIDDIDKLTERGIREFGLRNRLEEVGNLTVDGDPEMFYGATVQVEDPDYSGVTGRWFVKGYRSSITDSDFVTEIILSGGAGAGSTPLIPPFACFTWAVTGKVEQVLPVGIGPGSSGIVVTFDGTCSRDFDGTIASYAWSDSVGHVGTGPYFQAAYDPGAGDVDVTLVVTDSDGLTDSITKSVSVQGDDTDNGGQATRRTYMFVAAKTLAMASDDGGATWTDVTKAAAGVTEDFIAVGVQYWKSGNDPDQQGAVALFLTRSGEMLLTTDVLATHFKPVHPQTGTLPALFGSPLTATARVVIRPILSASACHWQISVGIPGDYNYVEYLVQLYFMVNARKPVANYWNLYVTSAAGPEQNIAVMDSYVQPSQPGIDWPGASAAIRVGLA